MKQDITKEYPGHGKTLIINGELLQLFTLSTEYAYQRFIVDKPNLAVDIYLKIVEYCQETKIPVAIPLSNIEFLKKQVKEEKTKWKKVARILQGLSAYTEQIGNDLIESIRLKEYDIILKSLNKKALAKH